MSDERREKTRAEREHAQLSESDVSTRLTFLLIGGGIGAILALLLAPKSGAELRSDIADVTRKGIDRTIERGRYIGDKASDYYEAVRDKASEWVGGAQDMAEQKRGQLSAAIEAGRQAYDRERRGAVTNAASDLGGNETKGDYDLGGNESKSDYDLPHR